MKQTINNNFSRRFLGLGIVGLMIIFAVGCGRTSAPANGNTGNNNTANSAVNNSAPTNTNSAAPTSATSPLEQKANAIVGKWETTTALDDKIMFDFSQPKKEGETYVGTYKFIVNDDTSEPPAKYVVSADKMIKFFNEEGKEYPLIKVSVSDDGKTLMYFDQKGGQSKLTRVTASPKKDGSSGDKADCEVKIDNADFYVTTTDKEIKLKKGTPLMMTDAPMGQGIVVVKAKVGIEWIQGEIKLDDTTCNDVPEDSKPTKK
ncbi:MAG: hypothetical protein IPN69_13240 [Acidobacteria bacterium]|nr:hypothetical protein [Acidobacteriota bacterium]